MKTNAFKWIASVSLAALVSTACDVYVRPPVATAEVDVGGPPPAPLVEVETPAPDPSFVWVGGAWVWGGSRWDWQRGRWERPPHRGAVWHPNHYEERNGRHVWVRGGWR